jgi:hypothetical protein
MKDLLATALILLNTAFVVFLCGLFIRHQRKQGQRLDAAGWFVLVTIGIPAVVVFGATLLSFK